MTHEASDVRVRRTDMLLRKTLLDLIAEKGFDAVTVNDIARRAMVNRSTFYRHYPDKYALVSSIFEEAADRLINELGQANLKAFDWTVNVLGTPDDQSASPETQQSLAAWTAFFEHFARHATLYQTMLSKQGSSWFAVQMRDCVASVLRRRLQLAERLRPKNREQSSVLPEDVAVMSLANWLVGILTWWLEDGVSYPPEQMAMWSLRCIAQGYVAALGINVLPTRNEHESMRTP
ncbi:MAG TPA: TetR/AcrR family transcriptional regulator [Ktedonobacteraceae bacterium]|nr:TetR/AcrR family transcriptional regulator [Ktedonobacteraceae bacterium]